MAYLDQSAEKKVAINFKKERSEKEEAGRERGLGPGGLGACREPLLQGKGASTLLALWPLLLGFPSLGKALCSSHVGLGQASSYSWLKRRVGRGGSPWLWGLLHSAHLTPGGDSGGEGASQLHLSHLSSSFCRHTPTKTWGPRPPARNFWDPQMSSLHSGFNSACHRQPERWSWMGPRH